MNARHLVHASAAAVLAAGTPIVALAADIVVNLTGLQSRGVQGDSSNVSFSIDARPGALVDMISWNLTLSTVAGSYLSEAVILISNSGSGGIAFNPGFGEDEPGTNTFFGSVSLSELGASFNVLADGKLSVELYETFDDLVSGADATYTSGSLTLAGLAPIPEPATYGLMALGLLGVVAARRRQGRSAGAAASFA